MFYKTMRGTYSVIKNFNKWNENMTTVLKIQIPSLRRAVRKR